MPFGQVVIGPPGSGKSTYCYGLQQFFSSINRKVIVVNLDPGNFNYKYECAIDIRNLITIEKAMETEGLGPNGAIIYCMEYLTKNFDWLLQKLQAYKDTYYVFDCPGQVELFTHNFAVKTIVEQLQKVDYRLVAVHLVDSHYCSDPSKYLSVLLVALKTMLMLELPHVNVLSKIDLVEALGPLNFYCEVLDLNYLVDAIHEDGINPKYRKLTQGLVELIDEFGLVNFYPLHVEDKISMSKLIQVIDRTNGFVFGGLTENNNSIFDSALDTVNLDFISDLQEKFIQKE